MRGAGDRGYVAHAPPKGHASLQHVQLVCREPLREAAAPCGCPGRGTGDPIDRQALEFRLLVSGQVVAALALIEIRLLEPARFADHAQLTGIFAWSHPLVRTSRIASARNAGGQGGTGFEARTPPQGCTPNCPGAHQTAARPYIPAMRGWYP
jgi:hypothetical protein